MTANKIFLDTNVLVYAYDTICPLEQTQAVNIIKHLGQDTLGMISTQILAEFVNAATRKLTPPLTFDETRIRVTNFIEIFHVSQITNTILMETIRGVQKHQLQFWHSLVWSTAKANQITVIFTEDFSEGQVMEMGKILFPPNIVKLFKKYVNHSLL